MAVPAGGPGCCPHRAVHRAEAVTTVILWLKKTEAKMQISVPTNTDSSSPTQTQLSSCCGVNELGARAQNDPVLMHELSGAHARAERALAQINQLTLSIGPGVDDLGADAGAGWGT